MFIYDIRIKIGKNWDCIRDGFKNFEKQKKNTKTKHASMLYEKKVSYFRSSNAYLVFMYKSIKKEKMQN